MADHGWPGNYWVQDAAWKEHYVGWRDYRGQRARQFVDLTIEAACRLSNNGLALGFLPETGTKEDGFQCNYPTAYGNEVFLWTFNRDVFVSKESAAGGRFIGGLVAGAIRKSYRPPYSEMTYGWATMDAQSRDFFLSLDWFPDEPMNAMELLAREARL